MTPMEQLMDKLSDAATDSADYGMTYSGAAATVLQLGLKLSEKVLTKEGLVILLRRVADNLAEQTSVDVIDLFNVKPEGRA